MERKRLMQVLVTLFIAIIFISSYFSLTNYNNSTSKTSTTVPPLYFANSIVNAPVSGYGNAVSITVACSKNATNSTMDDINTVLSSLAANNSIQPPYSIGNKITVIIGNMNASVLYNYVAGKISDTQMNCSAFSGSATILLPYTINASVQTSYGISSHSIRIPNASRAYFLPITFPFNSTNGMKVSIRTYVTTNYTAYGNLNVTKYR